MRLCACLLVISTVKMVLAGSSPITFDPSSNDFLIASSNSAVPIIVDSQDAEGLHIAAENFASDVQKVTGSTPEVHRDVAAAGHAIIVCTAGSALAQRIARQPGQQMVLEDPFRLQGKWESFVGRVISKPIDGVEEALVLVGSDRRGAIYALYTLSEYIGVSPFYWWADVPTRHQSHIAFKAGAKFSHGEPTVKYRGFFLNDEHPVLWNWAKQQFNASGPPFQTGLYEKVFELCLRLKGNYLWPAMWHSAFAVDGLDTLPSPPTPGPNQALAEKYGVVMGTSHHEPMSRNQKEFHDYGHGEWDYDTNKEYLDEFWKYGADRAKGLETLFTVGMRGDGDLALPGADIERLERITAAQQDILKSSGHVNPPQMWAMYKEVMGYFASGLKVPKDVTPLLSDDNWGNLMAIMPDDQTDHPAGGGVYYHADYVGDPRDYKWLNTVPLAKMWQQLNLAKDHTKQIWILNVGDLKMLELPLEWFMSLAYDFEAWGPDGLDRYMRLWAAREFGQEASEEVADIMLKYTMYASRRKAELVDSETFSLINDDEAERVLLQWSSIETRAEKVYKSFDSATQLAFDQLVRAPVRLQANLNRLYVSAAKSNLYATQGRTAANVYAKDALTCFEKDNQITQEFHKLNGGKWNYALAQTHIGYQYWQAPVRNSMPPISFVQGQQPSAINVVGDIHTRYTVENSYGAWPGDNRHNCPLGYNCSDPVLEPVSPYGHGRWVDVGSGGTMDVTFTAEPQEEWMKADPRRGLIKADGTTDTRVWLNVDWKRFPEDQTSADGHVRISSSDGTSVIITIPATRGVKPPSDFHGAVQGDGVVAIEAAHYQRNTPAEGQRWVDIPHYGRTLSGMTILPPSSKRLPEGPTIEYDFWITLGQSNIEVDLHIGPSLNYILGQRSEISLQLDNDEVQSIKPIPKAEPGTLPQDWENVVSNEIRVVSIPQNSPLSEGKHTLKIGGVFGSIVLERVIINLGGLKESYLGPRESVIL